MLPFALPGLTTANGRAMAGPSAVGQARVGERSMGTGGRAASACAVGAADVRRSQGDSPLRWRARRCSSTNRRRGLARRAGARPTGTGSRPASAGSGIADVAPQTAVGPERRLTPTPEPASPRSGRRRPARPPDRAGRRRPTSPRTVPADRAQHHVQHRARRPPCPAARCRCRTWATARTTGSRSRHSHPEIAARVAASQRGSTSCPRSAKPAPPGCPSCTNTVGRPV